MYPGIYTYTIHPVTLPSLDFLAVFMGGALVGLTGLPWAGRLPGVTSCDLLYFRPTVFTCYFFDNYSFYMVNLESCHVSPLFSVLFFEIAHHSCQMIIFLVLFHS